MFNDVDESLRALLIEDMPIERNEVDISFDRPTREWSGRLSKPTLNLFLMDMREHPMLRNDIPRVSRQPDGSTIKEIPERRIDLSYVITAWAREAADEHRILARVLATMFRRDRIPEEHLVGQLQNARSNVLARIMPPDHLTKPADFWGVMDNELHSNLTWVITAPLNAFEPIVGPMVRTAEFRFSTPDAAWMENTFHIGGRVHAGDDPEAGISGVVIEVLGTTLRDTTGEDGTFLFQGVPAGERTWRITPPEGQPREQVIQVPSESYDIRV
jgi:hypothetical protein